MNNAIHWGAAWSVRHSLREEYLVLYVNQKLFQMESKHSTIEKECLAIKTLWYYLLGHPFTVCLDNNLLQWFYLKKDASAWITLWYLALQIKCG